MVPYRYGRIYYNSADQDKSPMEYRAASNRHTVFNSIPMDRFRAATWTNTLNFSEFKLVYLPTS